MSAGAFIASQYLNGVLTMILYYYGLSSIFKPAIKRRWILLTFTAYLVVSNQMFFAFNNMLANIFTNVFFLSIISLMIIGSTGVKLVYALLMYMVCVIGEVIAFVSLSYLHFAWYGVPMSLENINNIVIVRTTTNIINVLSVILLVHLFRKLFLKRTGYVIKFPTTYSVAMTLIIVGVILMQTTYFTLSIDNIQSSIISTILSQLVLLMIIFLTIWIYNTTYKHMESLEENKQKDIMLEHWQSQYITAMNAQKVIVELNHNLQYHFLTLSCFLKKGKTEEAQKHIEKELGALDDITSTGNMPIDTMLNYYNHRARDELEIEIKTELAIPPDMHLDAVLVVTILGNALENAIEACHHLLLPERYIHVRASITESRALFIVITNPYALTPVADKNGRLLTSKGSKQLHGFGLSSIQEMFPEDAGQIYYEYKDNVFRFMFLNYNILDEKSTNVTSNLPNVTIVK